MRALFNGINSADCYNLRAEALTKGDAHAVHIDQTASFVDDVVADFDGIQCAVHEASEVVYVNPILLLNGCLASLKVAGIVRGEAGDLHDE